MARASARVRTVRSGRPMRRAARAASSCSALARPGGDLDAHRVTVDVDLFDAPRAATARRGSAYTERSCLGREQCGHRGLQRGIDERTDRVRGRPFFITIGVSQASAAPAVSSARSTVCAIVSPVASSTLASSNTRPWPADGVVAVVRRADDHLGDVGQAVELGRSGAEAGGRDGHRRQGTERLGQGGHRPRRRSGWRSRGGRRCRGRAPAPVPAAPPPQAPGWAPRRAPSGSSPGRR